MKFENVSSEIIDYGIAALNPLNDIPYALTEAVSRSNALREKRKIKKQKNNHNNNSNRNNNQYPNTINSNNYQYPRNNMQQTRYQHNSTNHNSNHNAHQNNQTNNQNRTQTNNRGQQIHSTNKKTIETSLMIIKKSHQKGKRTNENVYNVQSGINQTNRT